MISVCMATYNGEKYIEQQIASILAQLSENDELIVSDDGSSDHTTDILARYGTDRRIRVLHGGFHSPIYNFEHAIKTGTGRLYLHGRPGRCVASRTRRRNTQDARTGNRPSNLQSRKHRWRRQGIPACRIRRPQSRSTLPALEFIQESIPGMLHVFQPTIDGCHIAFPLRHRHARYLDRTCRTNVIHLRLLRRTPFGTISAARH